MTLLYIYVSIKPKTLYEVKMFIIKKLIKKHKLKIQLESIELTLHKNGFYEAERKLSTLAYYPDEYGKLYNKIYSEFNELLQQKYELRRQIQNLSGINLIKKQPDEYIK